MLATSAEGKLDVQAGRADHAHTYISHAAVRRTSNYEVGLQVGQAMHELN